MMINLKDQHEYTIKILNETIDDLYSKVENIEIERSELIKELIPFLESIPMERRIFEKLHSNNLHSKLSNYISRKGNSKYNTLLSRYYNILIKLEDIHEEIREYVVLLKKINNVSKYGKIIKIINDQITKHVLVEGQYSFGLNLSSLFIRERKVTDNCKNQQIDWEATQIKKQEIIDKGKTPYSKETSPDGEKYFVYFNNTYDYWWAWHKYICRLPNKEYYSFKPTYIRNLHMIPEDHPYYTGNNLIDDFLKLCNTPEKVLDSEFLGNVQKLNYLGRVDEDWNRRYKHRGYKHGKYRQ